jgi:hypothetical protein
MSKIANKNKEILKALVELYHKKTNEDFSLANTEEGLASLNKFLEFLKANFFDPIENFDGFGEENTQQFNKLDEDIKKIISALSTKKDTVIWHGVYELDNPQEITNFMANKKVGTTISIEPIADGSYAWKKSLEAAMYQAAYQYIQNSQETENTVNNNGIQAHNDAGYIVYRKIKKDDIILDRGAFCTNISGVIFLIHDVLEKYNQGTSKSKITTEILKGFKEKIDEQENGNEERNNESENDTSGDLQETANTLKSLFDTIQNFKDSSQIFVDQNISKGIIHSYYYFDENNKLHYGPDNLLEMPELKDFFEKNVPKHPTVAPSDDTEFMNTLKQHGDKEKKQKKKSLLARIMRNAYT